MPRTPLSMNELDSLLARLVDESITSEELARLEQGLDENPEAQRRYLHYLDLHAELVYSGASEATRHAAPRSARRGWIAAGLAAAIALSFATSIALRDSDSPEPVVSVVDFDGSVRWMGEGGETGKPISIDDSLSGGTLETISPDSWAEIAFPDGTSVSLAGQSLLSIALVDGQKVLRLREGNLSIEAAKQPEGRPLRVITPSAEAEVLGTQFNVKANAFSARFVVNEGLVRVKRLADGQVEEVAADQVVVAALEQHTDFTATDRRGFVESWKSVLPRDRLQGQWEPAKGSTQPGGLRAMPHLWQGEPGEPEPPVLLYSAVFDPSVGRLPPVRLPESGRLLVRGRLAHEAKVQVGFGTNRRRGGFVGKYKVPRGVKVIPDEGGRFAFELDLATFKPKTDRFPASPIGHEIDWLWIQTVKEDAGLVIESVELAR